jgi:serine/threonine protein kinase
MEKALSQTESDSNGRTSVLAPGAVLQDRYLIVRPLGKGGMGAVYEAVDQRLEVTVALKETFSASEHLRRQFAQEARLLAQLHHSALPRVSDYFTEGDRAFLVMQFISGVDLAEIVARQPGPLPRHQVIAWADQLLDALIYLHTRDRQIVHRDIKPHNLKLTSTGQIALLDFGLAKAEAVDLSATTSSVSVFGYTRRYSPLEQIQDQGTTPQSDIYALGATLYHLITGIKPPDALARATALVNSKPDPLRPADEIHPAVGPEVADILSRAMAQNPEDRYGSANEFREALWELGRSEIRAARDLAYASKTESASVGTVVKRAYVPVNDPFDSYSILKPDEVAWLIPKPSRVPGAIAAGLAILLAAGTFYGYSQWIEPSGSESTFAQTDSEKDSSATTLVGQSKSDSARTNNPTVKNVPPVTVSEANRKSDLPDRRNNRTDRSNSNTLKPQPSSSPRRSPIQTGSGNSRSRTVTRNR